MKQMTLRLINLPSIGKATFHKVNKLFCYSKKTDKPIYKYVYDEKYGCPRRVLTGYLDLQAFIEESRDSVDFNSLGKMLVDTKANIIDHFLSKDGEIIDITGLPRNIHEATANLIKLQESFAGLPDDLKALFDYDFDTFKASYRNGSIGAKFDAYYKSVQTPTEPTDTVNGGE